MWVDGNGMPFVASNEGNADVHIAMGSVVIAWRVLPVQHHTLLQPGEAAGVHLIGLEYVRIEPIHNVDQHNGDVYVCYIRGRRMETSADREANTANSVYELADFKSNVYTQELQTHRQGNKSDTYPANEAGQSSLVLENIMQVAQSRPSDEMKDAMQPCQKKARPSSYNVDFVQPLEERQIQPHHCFE